MSKPWGRSTSIVLALLALTDAVTAADVSVPEPSRITLVQAERLAVERGRDIQAARRALEASEADRISAGQRPNPNLSAGVSNLSFRDGWGGGTLLDKRLDTVIGIDQLIERGNKRGLRNEVAQYNVDASRGDLADTERQSVLSVRNAYYALVLQQERANIAAENAALYARSLLAAELRLKAGDVAPADVARIRVDALRSENDVRATRADLERARIALGYLIGIERDATRLEATDPWPAPVPVMAADDDRAVDMRPDVVAAQARVIAAERNRELARARRSRDVTLALSFERFPGDGSHNTIGVGISIPLHTSHAFEGEIRRAEVDFDAANDNLGKVRGLAYTELQRARADLSAAAERVTRFRGALLAEAARAAQAAEFAYERGALGVIDLLDARRTLRATQLEAASAEAEHANALAAWAAARGRRFDAASRNRGT